MKIYPCIKGRATNFWGKTGRATNFWGKTGRATNFWEKTGRATNLVGTNWMGDKQKYPLPFPTLYPNVFFRNQFWELIEVTGCVKYKVTIDAILLPEFFSVMTSQMEIIPRVYRNRQY